MVIAFWLRLWQIYFSTCVRVFYDDTYKGTQECKQQNLVFIFTKATNRARYRIKLEATLYTWDCNWENPHSWKNLKISLRNVAVKLAGSAEYFHENCMLLPQIVKRLQLFNMSMQKVLNV